METLPKQYCENMKKLLGAEYPDYIAALSEKPYTAFRINTAKISRDDWERRNPFQTEKVLWNEKGYYYDADREFPAKHPYYYAGLYYIQEPSAMIPAEILPIEKGDKVLDLCAAPGGKATELGARLKQTGLLVANDISASRTVALVKNIQLAGITNAVVTAETPQKLSYYFPSFFDKILVDAPCSGEGMFRRVPRMRNAWLERGPEYYAPLQREILSCACQMLKPGGKLVYSTCTFSIKENEETVQWILNQYEDMHICSPETREVFSEGRPDLLSDGTEQLRQCIRFFPHRAKGEGHFAVLLEKQGKKDQVPDMPEKAIGAAQGGISEPVKKLLETLPLRRKDASRNFSVKKGKVIWEAPIPVDKKELRILYSGLPVCEQKQKINLSPQLALILKKEDFAQVIDFSPEEENVIRYLKGETLQTDSTQKGDILICVSGYGLGWCKGNGQGMLKNKYYPGWRYQ